MSKVRIIFKSGYVQDMEAEGFKIKYSGEHIESMEWKSTVPRIMHIDVTQITAVFEL